MGERSEPTCAAEGSLLTPLKLTAEVSILDKSRLIEFLPQRMGKGLGPASLLQSNDHLLWKTLCSIRLSPGASPTR